jgi:hypothetical protein
MKFPPPPYSLIRAIILLRENAGKGKKKEINREKQDREKVKRKLNVKSNR